MWVGWIPVMDEVNSAPIGSLLHCKSDDLRYWMENRLYD